MVAASRAAGIGTLLNVVIIGTATNVAMAVLPSPGVPLQLAFMFGGSW